MAHPLKLKDRVAAAALRGAVATIIADLSEGYIVEHFDSGPLYSQVRVKPKAQPDAAPRYFMIKISEPL